MAKARKPHETSGKKDREIRFTKAFKKDLARASSHKKCDLAELKKVIRELVSRATLDKKYLDHPLQGRYPEHRNGTTDCRECHVCNDWLLVYRFPDDESVDLIRTGTHSDLFA